MYARKYGGLGFDLFSVIRLPEGKWNMEFGIWRGKPLGHVDAGPVSALSRQTCTMNYSHGLTLQCPD